MKIKVSAPATSANIGAGFDCMGMALNLFNTVIVENSDTLVIKTDKFPRDNTNMVYRAMNEVFTRFGCKDMPVKIEQINCIPPASGLGSSAACIVAGVMAANALIGYPLDEHGLVNLCTQLDGHPDNVVPAIKGGITAGVVLPNGVEYIKCESAKALCCAFATPDYELHTEKSRSVLPDFYSREDAVYSLSRAVLTFAALVTGDSDKLKIVDDKIHQPYRIKLIKGYEDVVGAFDKAGCISHFISGAGPTLGAFFNSQPKSINLPSGWTLRFLEIVNSGAFVQTFDTVSK